MWKCASCVEINDELHSEDLPLLESTRVSPLSIQENSYAISYEGISIISSPSDFENPSIAHSPNESLHNLHVNNGQLFDDSDEFDIPNISTENTNFRDFVIPETLHESSLDGSILESGNIEHIAISRISK